jgi:hypothetical protein
MDRPPAGMIDAMTKHLICRLRANHSQAPVRREPEVGLPQRADGFQEVAA